MSPTDGRLIPVQRAGWWERTCHWLACGGGYWEMDTETGEHTCVFCGFRAQWPSPEHSTAFVVLRARAHRLTRRG